MIVDEQLTTIINASIDEYDQLLDIMSDDMACVVVCYVL